MKGKKLLFSRLFAIILSAYMTFSSVNLPIDRREADSGLTVNAEEVSYSYYSIDFEDPNQLSVNPSYDSDKPFYLYTQDGVSGCSIQDGVLKKNGQHPVFGLGMYKQYGKSGKITAQFDLRSERGASRSAPWNTVYFGVRLPSDQLTGYMSAASGLHARTIPSASDSTPGR